MRRTTLFGTAALLIAAAAAAPVQAGARTGTTTPVAIREAGEFAPTWEDDFLRRIPPAPIAGRQLLASSRVVQTATGEASWYGPGFFGNRTASGEVFRPGTLTAAHRSLPFGTRVRVTNLWNGRSTVVRINDRGPFHGGRIIDLAHGAATELGLTSSGVAQVKLEVLQ